MVSVDTLISELKALYKSDVQIRFNVPAYERFHNDVMEFVYSNHFENSSEWNIISQNLVYKSSQYMTRAEADTILTQLDSLKRKILVRDNDGFWPYVHPRICCVSKDKFTGCFYADAVESAFKEVNFRVKQLYRKHRGEERDGQDLMRKTFSPTNPLLTFESLESESGRNVQEGYMQIFAGAIQGIRNPKAHENMIISREEAIKRLIFASLLMDKIDESLQYSKIDE